MCRAIILTSLILLANCSFGQELPRFEKKIYSSPDGKLFVQKSLPLYLQLSTDSTSKNDITIKNEKAGNIYLPFFVTFEGLNIFKTPSAVDKKTGKVFLPRKDVIFEIYADSRCPETGMKIENAGAFHHEGKIFTNSNAGIVLKAVDELSGVDKILYSIDSSEYKEYVSPILLKNENRYLLKYLSVDKVGNSENVKSSTIVIDNTAPVTTIDFKGDMIENIFSGNASIILKTSDNSSGLKELSVTLDGKPFRNFSGVLNTRSLPQGEHRLEFYATDNINNRELLHSYTFFVDRTPPTILQDIVGKSFINNGREYSSGNSNLKLTTLDNKAGVREVYYSINKGEYKRYDRPVLLDTWHGNISIRAYAVDNVNNRSEITDEATSHQISYIDLTGPQLKHEFSGPLHTWNDTVYISSRTKIHLLGFDTEAGFRNIEYSIDKKKIAPYNGPFSIQDEGFHSIGLTGYDNVENTSMASTGALVDNTGPVIAYQFSTTPRGTKIENGKSLNIYPSDVCLFLTATDSLSGFGHMTYQINGSPEKNFTGFLSGFQGINLIKIKAYDKLGNASEIKIEFAIK